MKQEQANIVGSISKPCLCGAHDDAVVFTARDQISWQPGEFQVVSCQCCGLIRTDPRPDDAELSDYYPEDYGPYIPPNRGLFRRFIKRVIPPSEDSSIPPGQTPGRALELGCSHGSYLDCLRDEGWSVTGVEFSESAAEVARNRGHVVHAGRVEDMSFEPSSFDLVVAWMVVEHLADPVKALEKTASWAAAGARLALSVPNIDSTSFRVFGRNWFNLQVPTHHYHFSPETIQDLLERTGWRVDRVAHQITVRTFVESARLRLHQGPLTGRSAAAWSVLSNALTLLGLPVAVYLSRTKRGDRITVWATKR